MSVIVNVAQVSHWLEFLLVHRTIIGG